MASSLRIKSKLHGPTVLNKASKLFQPITAIQKNVQVKNSEITSNSQRLMLDLGIIKQSSPGSFHFLPLALRSFEKLCRIVDEEMKRIGGQKMVFPTLTSAGLWKTSGRIRDAQSELFKLTDRHGSEYILSPTHEECAADLISSLAPMSYKNFPLRLYQITSKYRDEMKPRFGLMRARQFFMKDLYSFDVDIDSARGSYEAVCDAYDAIFRRIGIGFVKVLGTTGNMGGSVSHEYHFPANLGEDKILHCGKCGYSANVELVGREECPACNSSDGVSVTNGIEVGHTFLLGEKYSKPLKAHFLSQNSKPTALQMGSYGLGLSRILAAAVEILSLEHEVRWPPALAPFKAVVIPSKEGSKEEAFNKHLPEEIYHSLESAPGLKDDVLLDDRNRMTIGKRVLDARRTGHPFIVVAGSKTSEDPPLFEVIDVDNNRRFYLSKEQTVDFVSANKDSKLYCL